MEAYRSGHNGTDSKSVVPHGTVGSNPTASANKNKRYPGIVYFYSQSHDEESLKLRQQFDMFARGEAKKLLPANASANVGSEVLALSHTTAILDKRIAVFTIM